MKKRIDIISNDRELLQSVIEALPESEIVPHKNIKSFKRENISLMFIDSQIFQDEDSIQFLLSKVRKKTRNIPVMALLKITDIDKLSSHHFVDDFIIFPFRKGELAARVNRLSPENGYSENIITGGNLIINLNEYSVYSNNIKIDLTFKEFEILRIFMTNKRIVFSREDLLNKIWGIEYIGGTRTVDVHIRRLRSKLGDEFNNTIETVRNIGYRWIG